MAKRIYLLIVGLFWIQPFLPAHPYLPDPRHFGTPAAYQRACQAAEERHRAAVERSREGEEEEEDEGEEEELNLDGED